MAAANDDADADILAGVTYNIALEHPEASAQQILLALADLRDTIAAHRPDPRTAQPSNSSVLMSRILTRAVPALSTPLARDGARAFTRAFLDSHRRGTSQQRQVASIDLQFDRYGEVARFRRETWQRLRELARDRPAVAAAVDQGPIAAALGIKLTEDAATVATRAGGEMLRALVVDRVQPDGGMTVGPADVDALVAEAGAALAELRNAYAAIFVAINGVEEQARDAKGPLGIPEKPGGDGQTPKPEKTEVEKAIEAIEKDQKKLDELLGPVTKGVKGSMDLLAEFGRELGDDVLASDIRDAATALVTMLTAVREISSAGIQIAKLIVGQGAAAGVAGAIAFNIAALAVVLKLSGMLAKREKPINEVILAELRAMRKQLVELRDEMRVRFDRVEKRLNRMYVGILNRLDEMDFDLGQIEGDVDELQGALYDLHSELQRLNRDVHGFLEAEGRRPLVLAINRFLNFRERTGQDLSFSEFEEAESVFFSWGRDFAKDALQAGPEDRRFGDDDVLAELTSLPLATNINYLRTFPSERLALPSLSPSRLANPVDWIVAAEAYAQLSEESPAHAEQISAAQVEALSAVGEALGAGLTRIAHSDVDRATVCSRELAQVSAIERDLDDLRQLLRGAIDPQERREIMREIRSVQRQLDQARRGLTMCLASPPMFWTLAQHYRTAFDGLSNAISAFEGEFRADPRTGLIGIDPWGGAEQLPPRTFFDDVAFKDIRRCDGKNFETGEENLPTSVFTFDHSALLPYMIAHNLRGSQIAEVRDGLHELSACVAASWRHVQSEPSGLGGRIRMTFHMTITVNIRYGESVVFKHTFNTEHPHRALVLPDAVSTFDPVNDPQQGRDPYALLTTTDAWSKLATFFATHALVDPALRAATVSLVESKLVLLQRRFYSEVAEKFEQAGEDIQVAGQRLDGSKLLWQSFVTAGLPLSIEANELLRSLLFGSDAILAGTDADRDDSLLDDVQDIYAFFSAREEDPLPVNILGDIETLAEDRLERLVALLTAIADALEASGQPEPPEVFASTLLRLSLI